MHCAVRDLNVCHTMCLCAFQKVTKEYTFIIFLILMIGFTIFVYFLVPDTKGKTLKR